MNVEPRSCIRTGMWHMHTYQKYESNSQGVDELVEKGKTGAVLIVCCCSVAVQLTIQRQNDRSHEGAVQVSLSQSHANPATTPDVVRLLGQLSSR